MSVMDSAISQLNWNYFFNRIKVSLDDTETRLKQIKTEIEPGSSIEIDKTLTRLRCVAIERISQEKMKSREALIDIREQKKQFHQTMSLLEQDLQSYKQELEKVKMDFHQIDKLFIDYY